MTASFVDNDALVAPRHHLFLSPHYDDIALSCGGTAALIAESGKTPQIALIFGNHPDPLQPLTAFAELMHQQWGMSADKVIAGRRAEEASAAAVLGAQDRYLPFRDAIYRGTLYQGDDELFGPLKREESDLAAQLIESLGLELSARNETRLYAPLAIGNHVDHQHAFAAGLMLARQGWDVWFYEDLPYALKPDAIARRTQTLPADVQPAVLVDLEPVWQTKIDAIMAYPSQLGVIFGYVAASSSRQAIDAVMRNYAEEVGGGAPAERFWRVAE